MWTEIQRKIKCYEGGGDYRGLDLQAKNCQGGWPPTQLEETRRIPLPEPSERACHDTLISDYENRFLLLSVIQFTILCLGSPRKGTYVYGRLEHHSQFFSS